MTSFYLDVQILVATAIGHRFWTNGARVFDTFSCRTDNIKHGTDERNDQSHTVLYILYHLFEHLVF
jgi:hypothetical protein